MNLLAIPHLIDGLLKQSNTKEILQTNEISRRYGLRLSTEEAKEIVEVRNLAIQGHGRFEMGIEVVKKIIGMFSSSPYINQEEYALTVGELIEIFYYMKNETEDSIGDDELINLMKYYFDGSCEGSLELLKDRELESYARYIRRQNQIIDFMAGRED